jgi:acetamidase/formamidase
MARHILKATPKTVHLGGFSDSLAPVLRVQSGDRIQVETLTGFACVPEAPAAFVPEALRQIYDTLPDSQKPGPGPHLLTGPIWVEGAEPGQVLEVRLEAIRPGLPIGFNLIRPGLGNLPQRFSQRSLRFLPLDLERMVAEFPPNSGIQIPLRPFFGILGVATPGSCSSVPPGPFGGNLDNRHLQVGARVFLPIFLPGARFSIGDGHSAQGDGEVNLTAIETAMNGTITLTLRPDLRLQLPLAETPTHWITMGFGASLDRALDQALEQMINFLVQWLGLEAEEAYVLCSIGVDFNVTQVVNQPMKGVHGLLPKGILPREIEL